MIFKIRNLADRRLNLFLSRKRITLYNDVVSKMSFKGFLSTLHIDINVRNINRSMKKPPLLKNVYPWNNFLIFLKKVFPNFVEVSILEYN